MVVVAAWGFGGGDGMWVVLVFVWWVRWKGMYLLWSIPAVNADAVHCCSSSSSSEGVNKRINREYA